MAYNRWLSSYELIHHGVKGQHWGERNGPPYPLDSSKSDGHRLIKGDGSPQGKKRYKTSEKTVHKRAERKARTEDKEYESIAQKNLDFFEKELGWDDADYLVGRHGYDAINLESDYRHKRISAKEYADRSSKLVKDAKEQIENLANGKSDIGTRDIEVVKKIRDRLIKSGSLKKANDETKIDEVHKSLNSKALNVEDAFDKAYTKVASESFDYKKALDKGHKKLNDFFSKTFEQPKAKTQSQTQPSDNSKKAKMDDARNNDRYEMPFLEYIQNEDWYNDNDRVLNEYSKYLDDREAYARRGTKKR